MRKQRFPSFYISFLRTFFWLLAFAGILLPSLSYAQVYPKMYWQKFLGGEGDDFAATMERSGDGNLFLGGHRIVVGGCSHALLMKVNPEGETIWEREIGGSGCEEIRDLVSTPDSGVIFVGVSSSFITHPEKGEGHFQGDYFAGKMSSRGDILWLQTYGGLDIDQAFAVVPIGFGNFVLAGATPSRSFDVETEKLMTNLWVPRIDEQGNKLSAYVFGGNRHDWANSAWQCQNGDIIFAGFTDSDDLDQSTRRENGDGWVMRMDRWGIQRWQNVFSGKFEDYFQKVVEDKEGRIVLVGNYESEDKAKQFWLLKLSPEGKRISERIFGDREDEFLHSIWPTTDGGLIATGFSAYTGLEHSLIKGGEDVWLLRFDRQANLIWRETFGGPEDEKGVDVIEWEPGLFYVLANKKNDFLNNGTYDRKNDFWLLKIKEETCEDVIIKIFLSLKEANAFVGRSFKCRAIVDKGESFLWDFGDGTTSTELEPVHTYHLPGVYELRFTVFLNENCSKTYKLPTNILVW